MRGFVTRIDKKKLGVFDHNKTNLIMSNKWLTKTNVKYLIGICIFQHDSLNKGPRQVPYAREQSSYLCKSVQEEADASKSQNFH